MIEFFLVIEFHRCDWKQLQKQIKFTQKEQHSEIPHSQEKSKTLS